MFTSMDHDLTPHEIQMKAKIQYYGELRIEDKNLFKLELPLDLPWYKPNEKSFIKHKLGKLFKATMQQH